MTTRFSFFAAAFRSLVPPVPESSEEAQDVLQCLCGSVKSLSILVHDSQIAGDRGLRDDCLPKNAQTHLRRAWMGRLSGVPVVACGCRACVGPSPTFFGSTVRARWWLSQGAHVNSLNALQFMAGVRADAADEGRRSH